MNFAMKVAKQESEHLHQWAEDTTSQTISTYLHMLNHNLVAESKVLNKDFSNHAKNVFCHVIY